MRSRKPKRRSQLKRKKALNPGKALKRTSFKNKDSWRRLPASWVKPWSIWRAKIVSHGICVVCGEGPKAKDPAKRKFKLLDPHHVISQRAIKRYMGQFRKHLDAEAWEAKLIALLYDARNGLCICRACHQRHEKRVKLIPRALVSVSAIEFARELDLEWMIERDYSEAA